VRSLHTQNLLNRRKLCLVLDLDHTLLNTTSLHRLSPEEMHLKTYSDSLEGMCQPMHHFIEVLLDTFPVSAVFIM